MVVKALFWCGFHVARCDTSGCKSFGFLWQRYACGETFESASVVVKALLGCCKGFHVVLCIRIWHAVTSVVVKVWVFVAKTYMW